MTMATEQWTPDAIVSRVEQAQAEPCTAAFHELWYYAGTTWGMTRYKGVPTLKCPMDLQIYHEVIWQLRPQWVIETGTCYGGSAVWFADQMSEWDGRVISVDTKEPPDLEHERVYWIRGDSASDETIGRVRALVRDSGPVMVVLDSDHTEAHVRRELDVYAGLVTPGSFLVVEDTNISGRPIRANDPGPGAAVDAWLPSHPDFQPNAMCERNILTMHPRGWLQRVGQ